MKEDAIKYDVAISYAGENREPVRDLAERLKKAGYKVFYDEFEKAELWGEDLSAKLEIVYKSAARFCVIFVSNHYNEKPWTNFERQAAISRAFTERRPYVLPIRLDDTDLPGLPDTLGYLDLRLSSISEIFDLLSQKLGKPISKQSDEKDISPIDKEPIRRVLAACYRRAVFTQFHAQMSHVAMFNSLAECRATLQKEIVYVEPEHLQRIVAGIISELDFIERRRESILGPNFWNQGRDDAYLVNGAKLRIIASLLDLRDQAGVSFVMPSSVTSEIFFTEEDARKIPSDEESDAPWMYFGHK
jgi:uncharacterized protein (DUF2164 family)